MKHFVAVAMALFAGAAQAQDFWSDPFPGVRRLHRVLADQNINAAVVDLCAPGVSVRATGSGERGQRVSNFGNSVGAQVAINGDFYDTNGTFRTDGLTMHDGVKWPDTNDHNEVGQLAFGAERVEIIKHEEVITPAPWMKEILSGHWTLIDDGALRDNDGDVGTHPRTAVGLSKDKRTLILLVVDGRNLGAGRRGMTYNQLTAQMASLGAHWALGMDGGGSTTMWMAGQGVLNFPSDGAERTVGNHLAVYAGGSGAPAHCDRSTEEVMLSFAAVQEQQSSDLDGDGRADACARDKDGIVCTLAKGGSFSAPIRGPDLSDAKNWWWPTLGLSLRTGDVDGDKRDDVCARFTDGLHCWLSTGTGFGAEWTLPELAGDAWNDFDNVTTLMLGDWTGDGRADVCARADDGLKCWPSTGRGFGAKVSVNEFKNADFPDPSTYGTLRLADVDGDGRLDVCGRSHVRVICRLSDGEGFPTRVEGPVYTSFVGFGLLPYWSTFRMSDVNGDGKADACIRTGTEFRCHLSEGQSFAADPVLGPPLHDYFFSLHRYYSTLRLLDMDGDGDQDLCVRGGNGIVCWKWEGENWGKTMLNGPPLADATGWADPTYYRTIRAGDVNADGKEDLCARSAFGLSCWLSDGNGFPTQVDGPAWSNATWHGLIHAPSLRLSGPVKRKQPPAVWSAPPSELARPGSATPGMVDLDGDGRPDPGEVVGTCAVGGAGLAPLVLALGLLRRRRAHTVR
jgi:Phosphodiester glycosidase/FG-GAP-like repeat